MREIRRLIREIDAERNGFITNTELEDILRVCYKTQLQDKDIHHIIHPFESIQNRVLIDYKTFMKIVFEKLKELDTIEEKEKLKRAKLVLKQRLLSSRAGSVVREPLM